MSAASPTPTTPAATPAAPATPASKEATPAAKAAVPAIKWHPFYNDPCCDAVLVSNDGWHFRASTHRLSASSEMFEEMFDVVPRSASKKHKKSKSELDVEPIEIAYDHKTVKAFLDLINLSQPVVLTDDFWVITSLRELVRVLDCPNLCTFMQKKWEKAFDNSPIEGIIYASQLDDVELARRGFKECGRYSLEPLATLKGAGGSSIEGFWSWMDRLRPQWYSHLLRILIVKNTYGDFRIESDLSRMATIFDPSDDNGKKRKRVEEAPADNAKKQAT